MPNYRFYSRRNGYEGGIPLKYFHSGLIEDTCNESRKFVDKSGKEILKNACLVRNESLRDEILEIAKKHPTWYYYPDGTEIKDTRIY
jgi:hypothetical protein